MNEQGNSNAEAIAILEKLYVSIEKQELWNVEEAPDGHSFAWHGCNILRDATDYLLRGEIKPFGAYKPLYTR